MREVSAVGEIEAHDGVARLQDRGIGSLVGLRSGVRLHVDVLGIEELLGAVAGEVFDFIGKLAAAVITLAGIAFGVFVGENAAGGFEHRFRGEIFAGDQFDLAVLPTRFLKYSSAMAGSTSASGRAMKFCIVSGAGPEF